MATPEQEWERNLSKTGAERDGAGAEHSGASQAIKASVCQKFSICSTNTQHPPVVLNTQRPPLVWITQQPATIASCCLNLGKGHSHAEETPRTLSAVSEKQNFGQRCFPGIFRKHQEPPGKPRDSTLETAWEASPRTYFQSTQNGF